MTRVTFTPDDPSQGTGCPHPLDLLGPITDGWATCEACGDRVPDPFAVSRNAPPSPTPSEGPPVEAEHPPARK